MHNILIILTNHITAKFIKGWSESLINGVELGLPVNAMNCLVTIYRDIRAYPVLNTAWCGEAGEKNPSLPD